MIRRRPQAPREPRAWEDPLPTRQQVLVSLAAQGDWSALAAQATTWIQEEPAHRGGYEWRFIAESRLNGVGGAVSWAQSVIPDVTPPIAGDLFAWIFFHTVTPAPVGAWRGLPSDSKEAGLAALVEEAWYLARSTSQWAACALPLVRALQGDTTGVHELVAQARELHRLVDKPKSWAAAAEGLAAAGEGDADSARQWLTRLRSMRPDSGWIAPLEASLEIAEAGGLSAYRSLS